MPWRLAIQPGCTHPWLGQGASFEAVQNPGLRRRRLRHLRCQQQLQLGAGGTSRSLRSLCLLATAAWRDSLQVSLSTTAVLVAAQSLSALMAACKC